MFTLDRELHREKIKAHTHTESYGDKERERKSEKREWVKFYKD